MPNLRSDRLLLPLVCWAMLCAVLSKIVIAPFWGDDLLHVNFHFELFRKGTHWFNNEGHPPLKTLLVLPSVLLGWGKAWVTFPPLLCAVAAVFAAYHWLVTAGQRTQAAGLVFIFACSAGLYRLLGQLRTYPFVLFCFFSALWALEKFHESREKKHFRLAAGFALYLAGVRTNDGLHQLAELGVWLLLFTVGLKLRLQNLVRLEVLGVGGLHLLISSALMLAIFGSLLGFTNGLYIAVGLAFSSTVRLLASVPIKEVLFAPLKYVEAITSSASFSALGSRVNRT